MGTIARLSQVDEGGGAAWRPPAGITVEEFDEAHLDEDGRLDLDKAWQLIAEVLGDLGVKSPFDLDDEESLSSERVLQLASALAPLPWNELPRHGITLSEDDAGYLEHYWSVFRLYVIDAARGCNGIAVHYR